MSGFDPTENSGHADAARSKLSYIIGISWANGKAAAMLVAARVSPSTACNSDNRWTAAGCNIGLDMAELNEIYNTKLLELAAHMPRSERLPTPDASVTAHSRLCGSTVTIDLNLRDGVVADYGQTVKACLLGQAACAIVGAHIVGASAAEVRAAAADMRAMLKENGPAPGGRFAELSVLEPVRHYKARHGSVLLVFDALEQAIDEIEQANVASAGSGAASASASA